MKHSEINRKIYLGEEILKSCQDELYSYFPHFDAAFANVTCRMDTSIKTIATDGDIFYCAPDYLIHTYWQNPAFLRRGYLHMLLHCLYFHLFRPEKTEKGLWDLACDLAVEQIIEKQEITGLNPGDDPVRRHTFALLGRAVHSPQEIYAMLLHGQFTDSRQSLQNAFAFDDHCMWEKNRCDPQRCLALREKWGRVLSHMEKHQGSPSGRRGSLHGGISEEARIVNAGRYDYRKFLRRFAVPREEVELDTESFDYIYYCHGMERYGNMPLIEPLEYREVNRLEELVIAIDTSASCSRETVQRFLGETWSILSQRENFFHKMKVVLVQCDCYVQESVILHSEEEWKAYSEKLHIQGRSGTDFRPVFRYIEELRAKKELRNLKALIYFTDGDGIYPRSRPDYETAFVFLRDKIRMDAAPDWALKLVV